MVKRKDKGSYFSNFVNTFSYTLASLVASFARRSSLRWFAADTNATLFIWAADLPPQARIRWPRTPTTGSRSGGRRGRAAHRRR